MIAVMGCAIAAGLYLWLLRTQSAVERVPVLEPRSQKAAPAAAPAPPTHYPVGQAGEAPPLPSLEQSDTSVRSLLASLFGRQAFESYFSPLDIIRRFVATIDNLPREKAAQRLMPVRAAPGPMVLAGDGDARTIAEANAARYLPYVVLAESVDAGKLVAAYIHLYPLFQQAYRELGYPTEYFNDRLVQVIDHLLEAPELTGPVRLVQRRVLYEFADPGLEARSAGQKIMIRIGAANSARLRAKLRDIRRALTVRPGPP